MQAQKLKDQARHHRRVSPCSTLFDAFCQGSFGVLWSLIYWIYGKPGWFQYIKWEMDGTSLPDMSNRRQTQHCQRCKASFSLVACRKNDKDLGTLQAERDRPRGSYFYSNGSEPWLFLHPTYHFDAVCKGWFCRFKRFENIPKKHDITVLTSLALLRYPLGCSLFPTKHLSPGCFSSATPCVCGSSPSSRRYCAGPTRISGRCLTVLPWSSVWIWKSKNLDHKVGFIGLSYLIFLGLKSQDMRLMRFWWLT